MKRISLWLFAATAIGCASVARAAFREPVVTYKDAGITGLGLSGGNLEVVLSIYNPNSFRLDGTALTYRIAVDSVPFGDGSLSDRFGLDRAVLLLPAVVIVGGVTVLGARRTVGRDMHREGVERPMPPA